MFNFMRNSRTDFQSDCTILQLHSTTGYEGSGCSTPSPALGPFKSGVFFGCSSLDFFSHCYKCEEACHRGFNFDFPND